MNSLVNLNMPTQIKNSEKETHKSIFGDVDKLIISTSNLRNLYRECGECETQSNHANLTFKYTKIAKKMSKEDKWILTSQLWDDGTISSSFLPVNISIATKWHLACPCFPVLDVETSTTYFNIIPFRTLKWMIWRSKFLHSYVRWLLLS